MNKILLTELKSQFPLDQYVLMIGLGFDQRCLSVINNFPKNRIKKTIGILNVGWNGANRKNIESFHSITKNNGLIVGNNAKSVLEVADELAKSIINSLEIQEYHLVIDITSLSHELLIILIGILAAQNYFPRVTLLYVGAAKYSINSEKKDVWLSRGVRTIRSVLGFPGLMYPSKKLHLVLLAGFEVERANEVILSYEPSSLSIGMGEKGQAISDEHFESNQQFFEKLNRFIRDQDTYNQGIYHFEFSCISALRAKQQILEHVKAVRVQSDDNIVICPLNTKLSTVGVSLAGIEDPTIQICYAQPEEYNVENYAEPGVHVSILSLVDARH